MKKKLLAIILAVALTLAIGFTATACLFPLHPINTGCRNCGDCDDCNITIPTVENFTLTIEGGYIEIMRGANPAPGEASHHGIFPYHYATKTIRAGDIVHIVLCQELKAFFENDDGNEGLMLAWYDSNTRIRGDDWYFTFTMPTRDVLLEARIVPIEPDINFQDDNVREYVEIPSRVVSTSGWGDWQNEYDEWPPRTSAVLYSLCNDYAVIASFFVLAHAYPVVLYAVAISDDNIYFIFGCPLTSGDYSFATVVVPVRFLIEIPRKYFDANEIGGNKFTHSHLGSPLFRGDLIRLNPIHDDINDWVLQDNPPRASYLGINPRIENHGDISVFVHQGNWPTTTPVYLGGWIYFVNSVHGWNDEPVSGQNSFRMRPDGSDREWLPYTRLAGIESAIYHNNWIYFVNNGYLSRMNPNATRAYRHSNRIYGVIHSLQIRNNELYFIQMISGVGRLIRMSIDTGIQTTLVRDIANFRFMGDGSIISNHIVGQSFRPSDESLGIVRFSENGREVLVPLNSDRYTIFTVCGDYVYYRVEVFSHVPNQISPRNDIRRININTGIDTLIFELHPLSPISWQSIHIVGKYADYIILNVERILYRINRTTFIRTRIAYFGSGTRCPLIGRHLFVRRTIAESTWTSPRREAIDMIDVLTGEVKEVFRNTGNTSPWVSFVAGGRFFATTVPWGN